MSSGAPDPYYPPRASAHEKRLRGLTEPVARWLRVRQWWFTYGSLQDPFVAALLSAVPGLGHFWLGQDMFKSLAFLGGCLALALCGVFGPAPHLCFMALFGFHGWVVTDAYMKARALTGKTRLTGWRMIGVSLVTTACLGFGYVMVLRSATTLQLKTDRFAPMLERGDRLFIRAQGSYRRGDIVFSRGSGGLERVVAGPGDEVAVSGGVLHVNGEAAPRELAPLNGEMLQKLSGARARVPKGRYCVIFPSRSYYLSGNDLLWYYIVPDYEISGRLVLRYHPSWRVF